MQVIPSIDVSSVTDLSFQVKRLAPFYQRFQIDYADGKFVQFQTPPFQDLLDALVPFDGIVFDMHLMTSDYQKALDLLEQYKSRLNINLVFVHFGVKPSSELILSDSSSFQYGLVLNPEDTVDAIRQAYPLEKLKAIQIMSIIPGPQGNPFLPDTLNKIDQLRLLDYRNPIFLDGGVNAGTLKIIKDRQNLPDFICPGSFFSKALNVEEPVQYLSEVLKNEDNTNKNISNH